MLITTQQLMLIIQLFPASREGQIYAICTCATNIMIILLLLVQKELLGVQLFPEKNISVLRLEKWRVGS